MINYQVKDINDIGELYQKNQCQLHLFVTQDVYK
jgi:hypothetical protein